MLSTHSASGDQAIDGSQREPVLRACGSSEGLGRQATGGPSGGRGVVLLGHGSKDPEGVAELLGCVQALRERIAEPVLAGVLEYPTSDLPDVQTAFGQALAAGLTDLVGLPALLFFAGHTRDDMPRVVARARATYPELRIALAGPLGNDDRLLEAIEARLALFEQDAESAVLLVGRGSLNSAANADLHRLARMLWDRNRFGWVEPAFVSIAAPGVPEGIERCLKLGAKRVVVVPYFLNTGVLVKRIRRQAKHERAEVIVSQHLGLHPLVLDVLEQRLKEARLGMCPCQAAGGCRVPDLPCARGMRCPA